MMPRYHNGIELGLGTPTVAIKFVPDFMLVHTNSQGRPFYFVCGSHEVRMADTGEFLTLDPLSLQTYSEHEGRYVQYWSKHIRPKDYVPNKKRVISEYVFKVKY